MLHSSILVSEFPEICTAKSLLTTLDNIVNLSGNFSVVVIS